MNSTSAIHRTGVALSGLQTLQRDPPGSPQPSLPSPFASLTCLVSAQDDLRGDSDSGGGVQFKVFPVSTRTPTTVPLPSPSLAQAGDGGNPALSSKKLARSSSLPIMPGPTGAVTSGTSRAPLLPSEQTLAVMLPDASVPTVLHPAARPGAETEPRGAKQNCCSPDSRPKPDKTVNCPGWASPLEGRGAGSAPAKEAARRELKHGCLPARGAASGWL